MNINNIDNEDEDVIIEGTPLYEHLYKLGYMDFESVLIPKSTIKNEQKESKFIGFLQHVKNNFKKLFVVCVKIIQDDEASKKQIETILNAKLLLNDHACSIHSFLDEYNFTSCRATVLKFVSLSALLSSSVFVSYNTQYKNLTNLFTLFIICYISYMKCLKVQANVNLKYFVNIQTDLSNLCKKGLQILKYGYKIKLNKGKDFHRFHNLTADRLKYLQPIVENIVKCLEDISYVYYCASLILIKLLPASDHEYILTRFEAASFQIRGEINYQKLKTLYHIYILTQSEMLHLLATAYDNKTWQQSYDKIPELKLIYIIQFLIKRMTAYKNKLSEIITFYYNFKVEPMLYRYRGPLSSQWQDLHMHLHLASNKLQLAYSHILSILQDIDNISETVAYEDSVESISQTLNAAKKDIENAKDFVEFSNVFLVKMQINDCTKNPVQTNISTSYTNSDVLMTHNSEPQILDEVFEEYIKEEYLKPLIEENDKISLFNCKQDKLLIKSFMTELKDVLLDKQKSMTERESKALERMYKNVMKKTIPKSQPYPIPTPPPLPPFNTPSSALNHIAPIQSCNDLTNKLKLNLVSEKPNTLTLVPESETDLKKRDLNDVFLKDLLPISVVALPKNTEFSSFLKTDEETFVGSGENSEDDEIINITNDKQVSVDQ